ncbi:pentatricopeptide repeat-containing protein At2g17033 isoform X1 [Mercurialis annua]|uniref:pentatricopeptide repeat-containing protein At2g17033 isoform X1 n=1 Tax=Mercurialis annua TaxID=3986 RepID=UPI00215FC0D7|nr:pentatricopeptide repeat-containing protein At2g17033 isoform X1 [Mercurialis annua]
MHSLVGHQPRTSAFKLPWTSQHRRHNHRDHHQLPKKWVFECAALSKQGQRLLSSAGVAAAEGDSVATSRLIKKFVGASPKHVALDALSHLLNPHSAHAHLSSLAFPLYMKISETSWFDWNPKLVAELAALLDKQGQHSESATLISDTVSKLGAKERDLALFYCNLVESQSKHNSIRGFDDSFADLMQLVSKSTSVYVKKQGCKSMINGLCEMSRPREAEILIEEMRGEGVKPSLFELRCVVYAYGRLGFFQEMKKCIDQMEKEGIKVDTVCSNMILASYGAHNALLEMVLWLRKMKNLGIPFSIRTCNSVLNSCPTIMSTVQNSNDKYPISIHELTEILSENEGLLVKEIVESSILDEVVKWDESESKVDLHGLHLCSAYVVMLIWIEETRKRFGSGKYVIPSEIRLVCGSGKHSIIRGESPVKSMVKEIMVRTKSPMRIDRKNTGCFIAKGKIVKEWLCANNDSSYFTVS